MRTTIFTLAAMLALTMAGVAQTPASGPGYPPWTGSQYPFAQHYEIMLLHFDQATIAMAEIAQAHGQRADVRQLAQRVIADRKRETARMEDAYQHRYGGAPPAWPGPPTAGRWGGGTRGYGMGYGPGAGPRGSGSYGPGYGPWMMGYGDNYQTMMGYWYPGTGSYQGDVVDRAFVQGLMRQDAMQVSIATAGLESGDAPTRALAQEIIEQRTTELQQLARSFSAWFGANE